MSIITYKGYTGKIEVDIESAILHGRILDTACLAIKGYNFSL